MSFSTDNGKFGRMLLVAAATVLLAACAGSPKRDQPAETIETPAPVIAPPANDVSAVAPINDPPILDDGLEQGAVEPVVPKSFWDSIRDELQFAKCANEDKRSTHWTGRYAGYPKRFAQTLNEIAPLMQYVAGELRANDLPVDFVFLPIVESTYYPHRSRGDRPAGIWQLMPQTARGFGAPMKSQYDGRLDYAQATHAAMRLLTHLRGQFGDDWKLVNMAFNAGEYRVKNALKGPNGSRLPEPRGLSPITIDHWAKLRSLGCLIDQPERFDLELPPIDDARSLAHTPLPEPWPIEFVAHLAGIDDHEVKRWNPGLFGTHTPGFPEYRIMLPARVAGTVEAALAPLPKGSAAKWQHVVMTDDAAKQTAAAAAGIDSAMFAAINRTGGDRVWLPTGSGVPKAVASVVDDPNAKRYKVRSGDSLWLIAKRYKLRVQQLIDWNGLGKRALIKPGQWIKLTP